MASNLDAVHRVNLNGYFVSLKGGKGTATSVKTGTIDFTYNEEGDITLSSSYLNVPQVVSERIKRLVTRKPRKNLDL